MVVDRGEYTSQSIWLVSRNQAGPPQKTEVGLKTNEMLSRPTTWKRY